MLACPTASPTASSPTWSRPTRPSRAPSDGPHEAEGSWAVGGTERGTQTVGVVAGVQFGGFLSQVGLEEDVEGFVDHPMAPGSLHAVEHVEPPVYVSNRRPSLSAPLSCSRAVLMFGTRTPRHVGNSWPSRPSGHASLAWSGFRFALTKHRTRATLRHIRFMDVNLLPTFKTLFVLPLLLSPASPPFPFVALARLGPLSAPPAPPRLPAGSDGAYGMGEYVMYQQGLSMFK